MTKPVYLYMKWIDRLVGFFVRPNRFSSSDEIWVARTTFIYTSIGALVAGVYAIFYWTFASYGASLSLGLLTLTLLATTPLYLFGHSHLVGKINLSATSLGLAGVVIHMGGVDSSAACWLLGVTPGIAALIFRRAREIFQLTTLTICLYALIFVAEISGYQVYQFVYPEGSIFERIYTFVHFMAFSIFIGTALAIFATTQGRLLNQVEQQARDVKAILSNIQQGIFTVSSSELRVGEEYSDYLEKITETKGLRNHNAIDLIFRQTDLNREQLDMIEAILINCINESSLNFTVNEGNLIREAIYTAPGGHEKKLLFDWQPIVNQRNDTVEKILVTLSDVTELQKIRHENKIQQREIEIISEITEVSHEKFEQFIRHSSKFLDESMSLTESGGSLNDLKILFINMHTLKGAARTYRFKHMTAIIHDCEHYYAEIQREGRAWNRDEAFDHLQKVKAVFAEYTSISRDKLKRGNLTNQVHLDLETVRENIRLLQNIEAVAFDDRLTPFFQNVKKTLYGLYYMNAETLFHDIFQIVPSLAGDLGKMPPLIDFKTVPVGITADGCDILRNAFVHILRNSMDHGLEESELRKSRGKPVQGSIHVDITVAPDDSLEIRYGDDGSGLALDRIRGLGLQKHLIDSSELNPQKIAELIFHPGFSTARTLTDISGRGVGMGAVREFFEQAGGRVELRLKEARSDLGPTPFEFVLILPKIYFTQHGNEKLTA